MSLDDYTTREIRATVASLPDWDGVSSEVTFEWKSRVNLQACSWEWVDLRVKVKGALASTFLRGEVDLRVKVKGALASTFLRVSWLESESQRCIGKHVLERWSWPASERAAVLLVDTSKATQEQALQFWAWNIQKQQQRWRWRQVLERCCRGSSRGETDNSGPFQAPYIPQEVGRVTIRLSCYRTSQYIRTFVPLSVSLWNYLANPVFDGVNWLVSREGPMLLCWPKLLYPYSFFLYLLSVNRLVLRVGVFGLIGCISLSVSLALETFLNYINNNNNNNNINNLSI